jgi:hypothetical protein
MMWLYNTQQHRTVGEVPYRLVFGQHPRVGISGLHLEQDLLDRLATEADLNKVVEYEGMEVVLDGNGPNDAREKDGVAEMEDEWQGDPGEKDGVLETEEGVAEESVAEKEEVNAMAMATGGDDDDNDGELPVNHLAMVVAEQGVPSTRGHKTTGDVGFTKWQVMMSDLGDTIIDHNYLQQMCIRHSIPVMWCLNTKKVQNAHSFVPAILVLNF